jgi:hypothetical protein
MSPQFVDYDADGLLDIVVGNFGGSPYVSLGTKEGYSAPRPILDAQGQRILLNQFWNYDTKEWDTTRRCDEPGAQVPEGQATSAVVFDWDADGDLDLLLGDYKTGRIYRRTNEGKPKEPRFAGVNVPVRRGEEPLVIPGRIETLRLIDMDRDGRIDLLCGSVGDPHGGSDEVAGVYWLPNVGERDAPRFEAPRLLLAAQAEARDGPPAPYGGFYPDAADYDGDGDLDLVVGAKAHWVVAPRELTETERETLARSETELAEVNAAIDAFRERLEQDSKAADGTPSDERQSELLKARKSEIQPLTRRRDELTETVDRFTFGAKDGYRIWLHERGP